MKKPILIAVLTCLALTAGLLLTLFYLPASVLPRPSGDFAPVPVGDATAARGQGLLAGPRGTDVLSWHWCPGRGLNVFCFQSSGQSGFYQGLIAISPGTVTIPRVGFSGVDSEVLNGALGNVLPSGAGALSGELIGLSFSWKRPCLPRALATALGEVRISGLGAGARRVSVTGDDTGIRLDGDVVSGRLALDGKRITGDLKVALPPMAGGGDKFTTIAVTRMMACL